MSVVVLEAMANGAVAKTGTEVAKGPVGKESQRIRREG